ncbi:kinase-like domain-containing protein, partial [Syncephalis fuscata]
ADLIALCQERGLATEGTKEALIQALMDWKLGMRPVPVPATPKLMAAEPKEPVKKAPVNSVQLSRMLIDDADRAEIGEIAYDQLTYGRKLGAGGFKDCFAEDFLEIKHEISVLKQLRHDNIVRFIGVCTSSKHLCIVTELCDNGDLYDYMRKAKRPTFSQQLMYMHDIAFGVSYLHTRRPSIIHRDLKSMNILASTFLL